MNGDYSANFTTLWDLTITGAKLVLVNNYYHNGIFQH